MKTEELKKLRDKCLLFNQFMIEKGGFPPQLADSFKNANNLIETAYKEGNIQSLKTMSMDIDNQVLKEMPISMSIELKKLFKEKLDIDFDFIDKALNKALNKILAKGKISDISEYELLHNRVDEIYSDINKAEEVEKINKLLAGYETK